MYQLRQLDLDFYEIHSSVHGVRAMRGNLLAILAYCVQNLGFNVNELEVALLDMLELDEDTAEFGANRKFIHSFERKKAS